jgi:exopolysaccharide biosynthesis polyprenyl glycosylphosphotransferase
VHKALDVCFTIGAFVSAYFIKLYILPETIRGLIETPSYYTVLLLIIIIWPLSFNYFKLYASYRTQSIKQILLKVVKSVFLSIIILNFIMYLLKINDVSRIMMCIFFLTNIIFLFLNKSLIYRTLKNMREKGYNYQNILIIGGRERAKEVINNINKHSSAGYRILGCLGLLESEVGKTVISGTVFIGTIDELENIILEQVVDQIIFALPLDLIKNIEKYIRGAEELGVSVRIIPDWNLHKLSYNPQIARLKVEEFLDIPTMCLSTTPTGNGELQLKNMVDLLGAAVLILLLLPLFGSISILISIFSKGPVLYTQIRCGLNGRHFYVYKFRTMVNDAEQRQKILNAMNEADGPTFKIRKDPRIIPYIGTFLRKTGLDELPQLFNVIKGEMSLVGPRPPIPSEVKKYDRWQRRRLSMKPGITCLWQCSKRRNDITFKEWMSLDLNYIDSWSLKLDFKILIKTALAVFTGQGR